MKSFTWHEITEHEWETVYQSPFTDDTGMVTRIFPGTREYAEVVQLRYHGLMETGFIDPKQLPLSSMELPRDSDSIILAIQKEKRIVGTITLNTITPSFPGLSMELEKGAHVDHPYYRSPDTIELTKLVIAHEARSMKLLLNFSIIPALLGRIFNKLHHWQVSRNFAKDTLQRERLGFGYSNGYRFIDRSLNNMDSRIGYVYIPEILKSPKLLPILRDPLRQVLELDIPVRSSVPYRGDTIDAIHEKIR